MPIAAHPGSITQRLLPIFGWLAGYRREWLLPDILAGLAVWAVMVPEGMAYAGIVGVPPIMGLYTIVPPLIAYALLGTSRLLVVGPDTATGLISALTVGAIAAQGTAEFNTLTSTLAILIGAFFLLFGALRMGWVAAFIPTPVMRGFIEGLVCVTIIGQVPHLLGIEGTSGNFFTKLWFVIQHLSHAPLASVLTGLLSLIAMLLLRHLAPRVPAALVVAVAATILVGVLGVKQPVSASSVSFHLACLTLRSRISTLRYCGSSHPVHSRSCWSAMPKRSAEPRPRRCKVAATSIRTRS
jgi:MFS superfamily sulfate permease-like transporter